jgi:hypothetical protein
MKEYELNIQELCNSIEKPNLQIMVIKEAEVKAKDRGSIFKKIKSENLPNHEKEKSIDVQEASRKTNSKTEIEFLPLKL